ncbi:MAG: hypothetical protein GY786_22760, partial [Proteobacteria bacterium]|nr:hypothetical protein [Pseudomonadota bacterium]
IAVVLGIKGLPYFEGIDKRAEEAQALLEYGFENFKTIIPAVRRFEPLSVWEGETDLINIEVSGDPRFTLTRDEISTLKTTFNLPDEIDAPVTAGDILGTLFYYCDGRELQSFDLVASHSIETGGFFKVLWHKIKKGLRRE